MILRFFVLTPKSWFSILRSAVNRTQRHLFKCTISQCSVAPSVGRHWYSSIEVPNPSETMSSYREWKRRERDSRLPRNERDMNEAGWQHWKPAENINDVDNSWALSPGAAWGRLVKSPHCSPWCGTLTNPKYSIQLIFFLPNTRSSTLTGVAWLIGPHSAV